MADYLQDKVAHVDRHLSNLVIDYRPRNMIWDRVAPIINVRNEHDTYPIFNQADLLRRPSTIRGRGTEAQKVQWGVTSASYRVIDYALKHEIPIEDVANSDPVFRLQSEANRAQRIMDYMMLDAEARIGALVTNTSNVGSSTAVASAWTDYTNSDPFSDIITAIKNIEDSTGYTPNRAVFSRKAYREIINHNKVIDKTRGTGVTGGGMPSTQQLLASLFGLEEVLVGGTYINSGDEAQSLSLNAIWGDHVLLYYAPTRLSMDDPSYMYSFRWAAPGIPNMMVIRHPYNSEKRVRGLEVGYYQSENLISKPLAFLVTNVTSSS